MDGWMIVCCAVLYAYYLQLHDHHYLRLVIIGRQALNQLVVAEMVHELDLLAGRLPLLFSPAFVELSGTHPSCLSVGQLKNQAKLSPGKCAS